jgi:nitroreductase
VNSGGSVTLRTSRVLAAVRARRSHPSVTADAPSHDELLPLVEAAASVADHGALHPWRLIELRGAAREALGAALVAATEATSGVPLDAEKALALAAKPLRASLLIAIVAVQKPSIKAPEWEQDASTAGVAHALSLLLAEAGWGVFWRSGGHTRSEPVRAMHRLAENEKLLGWLYVGGIPENTKASTTQRINPEEFLTTL